MYTKAEPHVLDTELPLENEYPVYGDYWYWVDGRIERSDVFGTVRDLRRDLISQGRSAGEVRFCDMATRMKLYKERAA